MSASRKTLRRRAEAAGKHATRAKDYAQDCRESLTNGDHEAALDLALCAMASARASSRFAEQCIDLGDIANMSSIELAVSVAAQALAYAVETLEVVLVAEHGRLVNTPEALHPFQTEAWRGRGAAEARPRVSLPPLLRVPVMALGDIIGQRFGSLVVTARSPKLSLCRQRYWECRCQCGALCTVVGSALRSGAVHACKACRPRAPLARLQRPAPRQVPEPRVYRVKKAIVINGETVVTDVTVCPPGLAAVGPEWLTSLSGFHPTFEHARAIRAARDARERARRREGEGE